MAEAKSIEKMSKAELVAHINGVKENRFNDMHLVGKLATISGELEPFTKSGSNPAMNYKFVEVNEKGTEATSRGKVAFARGRESGAAWLTGGTLYKRLPEPHEPVENAVDPEHAGTVSVDSERQRLADAASRSSSAGHDRMPRSKGALAMTSRPESPQ